MQCPACGKGYRKKNRTVLKVLLGIVVPVIVLAVGCTALIGGAANEVVGTRRPPSLLGANDYGFQSQTYQT